MEIKEILDKLDSKVFTDEIKSELVESFTSAVNDKVASVTEKLETEYIDKEVALERKYTKKLEKFYESERKHISDYLKEMKHELTEELITKYSDEILVEDALKMYRKMQNFISESSSKLNAKPEVIKENEKTKLVNAKLKANLEKQKIKMNELSRFALIKENYDEIKNAKVKEQFEKLAEEISFDGDVKTFNRKLTRIRENLETEYNNILESLKTTAKKEIKESQKPKEDKLKKLKESILNRKSSKDIMVETKQNNTNPEDDLSVYL